MADETVQINNTTPATFAATPPPAAHRQQEFYGHLVVGASIRQRSGTFPPVGEALQEDEFDGHG